MVKILTENKYVCEICHRIYPTAEQARKCQNEHDIIYVPFQREDLKRLISFIHIGEPKLLTPSLLATLEHYATLKIEPVTYVQRSGGIPTFEE